jgi:hypothetical protein
VEFPTRADRLTAPWLNDALRAAGALTQARVTALAVEGLDHEKGLSGQVVRVRLAYDRDEAGAPRSLVAKFSALDPQARAMFHAGGSYEREMRFYRELAPRVPLRTPRCYYGALDPDQGWSLLLLEDLAAARDGDTLRNGDTIAGCSPEEAELVVRALAAFHAAWWRRPELAELAWLPLRGALAVQHVPATFAQTWEPFLERLGPQATDEVRQIGAWLARSLGWLTAYVYEGAARTLIHNDVQGDNLCFAGAGATLSLAVLDWQLATRGCGAYDVAYFLGGNLDSAARREHELRLLRLYHALLVDGGVPAYPFEQCWDDYRLAMLQRVSRLIAVVALAPAARARAFGDVLVPRFCRAIHDLDVGALLPADR